MRNQYMYEIYTLAQCYMDIMTNSPIQNSIKSQKNIVNFKIKQKEFFLKLQYGANLATHTHIFIFIHHNTT